MPARGSHADAPKKKDARKRKNVTPLLCRDPKTLTRRQAREILARVAPYAVKPEKIRRIVKRAMREQKSAEFAAALDLVLRYAYDIVDLHHLDTAMHPDLVKEQRSGAFRDRIMEKSGDLAIAYKALMDHV
ncbi:MAG TPA: hypothetical protein VLB83_02120 [Candidatus Paceibacterota bacterium]|nr:hypothetical protein [Candidatus Paceibacterota bacterium]